MRPAADTARPRRTWTWWLRWAIGIITTVGGIAFALLIVAVGHCSAFGGRCPAAPEPLLHNEVFGSVAVTIAITVWVVGWCIQPSRRGVLSGFLAGIVIGFLAGLAAVAYAAG